MGTDDFEFDDLFGDDDEDFEGFELDDEESGFGFEDEEEEDFEDFEDFDDFEEEFDEDFLGAEEGFEEVGAAGGPSRAFVIIALGMMVVFIVAIILVLALVLGGEEGPSSTELTADAIRTENAGTEMAFYATKTQEPIDMTSTAEEAERVIQMQMTEESMQMTEAAQETATAEFFADQTATAEAEEPTVEVSPTPTVDELARLQTAQAQTAIAAQASPEETAFVQPTISVGGVAATATAIAAALQTPIVITSPTELPIGGASPSPTNTPRALPTTGLLDGVSSGGSGFALMVLAAFGLVGLIFGARTLRTLNRRRQ